MADICTIAPFPRRASMKKWQMFVECTSRVNGPLKTWRRWELVCQIDVNSVLLHVVSEVCIRLCHFCSHLSPSLVNSVALLSVIGQWRFMNYCLKWCGRNSWFVMQILKKATKKPQSLTRLQRAPPGYGICLEGTQLDLMFLTSIRMLSAYLRLSWFIYPEDEVRSFVQNISACHTQEDSNPQILSLCGLLCWNTRRAW